MIVLEQSDYERLANSIVASYFQGTPLNDGILKVANDMGLNPAQVRQLVWQANTKTHLDLFEKKAEDKMIEFPLADADYVLRRMYTPEEAQPLPVAEEKIASDFFAPLEPVMEKVAEETFVVEKPEISEKTAAYRRGKNLRMLEKAASELELRVAEEREMYLDGVYKLAWEVRKANNREEFEKDAYSYFGTSIVPVLGDLRGVYGNGQVEETKLASTYERLVNTKDKNFKKLAEVKGHFEEAVKLAKALIWLNKKLGDIE